MANNKTTRIRMAKTVITSMQTTDKDPTDMVGAMNTHRTTNTRMVVIKIRIIIQVIRTSHTVWMVQMVVATTM